MSEPQASLSTDERVAVGPKAPRTRPFDISRHCLEGGTFVSNLDPDDALLLQDAIREFGEPRLLISDQRRGSQWPGGKSLHYLGDEPGKGSWNDATWGPGFWRTVDRLRPRHEEWLKLRAYAP